VTRLTGPRRQAAKAASQAAASSTAANVPTAGSLAPRWPRVILTDFTPSGLTASSVAATACWGMFPVGPVLLAAGATGSPY
jgi:hypothetical protein